MKKTDRIAVSAMAIALAMILSFVESRIPPLTAIPGIKLGLANIAVIFALYKLGLKEAIIVSLTRVFLVSLLFGSFVSMLYGLCGAVVSLSLMILLKKFTPLGVTAISVVGGVGHNIGQIAIACFLTETAQLLYYLPFLILSGTLSGILIGIVAALVIKRLSKQKE